MRERPVLFSGPMVRAILDGRKTQTRRPVKPQPVLNLDSQEDFSNAGPETAHLGYYSGNTPYRWDWKYGCPDRIPCPFGQPGDRLWVRETWHQVTLQPRWSHEEPRLVISYRATDPADMVSTAFKWRPSIHMPRWVSRITLEITDVRVQRVQEISEEDAKAEGPSPALPVAHERWREGFHRLWDSVYAEQGPGWDANPWVWAITFRRLP